MHTDFRNEWLFNLGGRINIPELAFDDAGLCQLSLDDALAVTIYKPEDSKNLVLFGQLPVSNMCAELMQLMLIENRNHIKNNAPVISLSEQQDVIEVHFKFTQVELEATENVIDQLIANLEHWQSCLRRFSL